MGTAFTHRWDVSPEEARQIQQVGRNLVVAEDRFGPVDRVAGVDVGFEDGGAVARAAVAVLGYPSLRLLESAIARRPADFPDVPGLLLRARLAARLPWLAVVLLPTLALDPGAAIWLGDLERCVAWTLAELHEGE